MENLRKFSVRKLRFNEISLEIGFIEEISTTVLEVIKWCPKPYSTIPFLRENRFNPFDYAPLANLRFEIS